MERDLKPRDDIMEVCDESHKYLRASVTYKLNLPFYPPPLLGIVGPWEAVVALSKLVSLNAVHWEL